MLVRVLETRRELSTELATAAASWRPIEASGLRGKGGRSPTRGGVGGEELGRDAWKATASRRWPAALLSGGGAALCRRQRKVEREEEDDSWTCLQIQKSLGVLL